MSHSRGPRLATHRQRLQKKTGGAGQGPKGHSFAVRTKCGTSGGRHREKDTNGRARGTSLFERLDPLNSGKG